MLAMQSSSHSQSVAKGNLRGKTVGYPYKSQNHQDWLIRVQWFNQPFPSEVSLNELVPVG